MGHETSPSDLPRRSLLLVSALVEPSIGGVEHYVRWAREAFPRAMIDLTVLACAGGPNGSEPGADLTLPTFWAAGFLPLSLPTPRTLRVIWGATRNADAVLIQNLTHPLCFYAAAIARIQRVPAVTMVHEGDVPRFGSPLLKVLKRAYDATLARLTLRWAPPVAVSKTSASFLAQKFGRPVSALPYPIGALPTWEPPDSQAPFEIVTAARYAVEKRPLDIVEVGRCLPDVNINMYGNGSLKPACESAARNLANVRCNEGIPWSSVIDRYATASAVISASSHDNVQLGLLEPLSMGVPAVATNVGEAPSYFPGPLAGLLCPPGNPVELAAAIRRLRAEYDTWVPLFRANAERLRAIHSPDAVIEETMTILLAGSRAG